VGKAYSPRIFSISTENWSLLCTIITSTGALLKKSGAAEIRTVRQSRRKLRTSSISGEDMDNFTEFEHPVQWRHDLERGYPHSSPLDQIKASRGQRTIPMLALQASLLIDLK
jgi:hypothetical protein